MQIGIIGLGKMGFNLVLNLQQNQYDVIAYDVNPATLKSIQEKGIKTISSLKDLAENLESKRVIWMMMPAGEPIDQILQELQPYLSVGDILIDGVNSFYKDSMRRYKEMEGFQIDYLECSTNSEANDINSKVCATISGNRFAYNYCEQLFNEIFKEGHQYGGKIGSGYSTKNS